MLTEIGTVLTFASGRRHKIVSTVVGGDFIDAVEAMNLAVELYLEDFSEGPEAFKEGEGHDDN